MRYAIYKTKHCGKYTNHCEPKQIGDPFPDVNAAYHHFANNIARYFYNDKDPKDYCGCEVEIRECE